MVQKAVTCVAGILPAIRRRDAFDTGFANGDSQSHRQDCYRNRSDSEPCLRFDLFDPGAYCSTVGGSNLKPPRVKVRIRRSKLELGSYATWQATLRLPREYASFGLTICRLWLTIAHWLSGDSSSTLWWIRPRRTGLPFQARWSHEWRLPAQVL